MKLSKEELENKIKDFYESAATQEFFQMCADHDTNFVLSVNTPESHVTHMAFNATMERTRSEYSSTLPYVAAVFAQSGMNIDYQVKVLHFTIETAKDSIGDPDKQNITDFPKDSPVVH